ncbi:MAG: hypothetical protein J6U40_05530, partial [Kiritimatiellae bacterium]|nr:hypothetical protein [Kiritimatiellia bacterium]
IPIQLNGGTLALPASNGFAESVIPQWDLRSYYYPVDAILTRAEMGFSNELPEYTTYQYKTQWYIPESRLFRFCKNFDDGARLRIDGVDLLLDTTAGSTVTKENYPLSAGWHDVTLWYGNGAGASGPASTFRNGLLWGWPGETLQTDGRTFDILVGTFVFAPVIDRTLLVGPGGGSVVLAPQEALTATPSIILRGGVVMTEAAAPTDTVAFDGDVIIGSQDPAKVAVFDAAVALPSDKSLTFTGYVWLKRQPPEGFKVVDGTVFFLSEATRALQEELVGAGGSIGLAPFNFDAYPEPTVTVAANKELNLYSGSLSAGIQPSLLDSEPVVCDKGFAVAEEGYLNFRNSAAWQQDGAIAGEGKIWAEGTGTVRFAADNSAFTGGLTLDNPETVFPSVASAGAATATVWAFSRVQFDDPAASEESGATYPQHFQVSDGATLSCVKKVTLGSLTITEGANGTAVTLEGGDFQVDAEHLEVGPAFTLNGSGRLVLLISSENVVLPSVSGTGSLYLDGTGSVDALNVAAFGGTFAFGKGVRLVTFPRPIDGAVLWLDASARDSLVMSGDDVHEWYDVRDGAFGKTYPHAFLTTRLAAWDRDKSSFPPTRITDETLAPKAVIDFGPQNSGKWFAFSSDVPAQTIFYVIGSQNGGGCCFFSYSYNSTGICRNGNVDGTIKASDGLYNPANWSSPLFAQSYTRKNGNVCNPTTTGLSGGYDTIATRLSTIQPLDGMAKDLRPLTGGHADGPKRSGGMRFAEIIIYDRALSDAEIASVEAYLNGKWFKRVVTTDAGSVWNGTLRIDDENTIEVSPQSAALSVNELIGTGTLVKLGEGELQLDYLENFEGSLRVEEGDLTLGQTIPEPAFWTDASQSASIGTDADGRFYWRDRRWDDVTDYIVATQRWATAPTVMQNELNGLPVVALGSLSTSHDRGLQWSRTVNAAAIFMVIGSQYSGGTILGTDDGDCLFNRGNIANASTPIFHATWAHANIRNGLTRLDGVQVDGTKTGFSGGYQVLAIRPTAPVKVGQFAHDRELDATKTRDGGQRLGEVLIFTNSLTDIQFRIVEDYLYKRWI